MYRRTLSVIAALIISLCFTACSPSPKQHERKMEMSKESVIVLINPFIVPPEKLDETITMWEEARDYLQTQPGYISTALHQSLTPDATFRLINVAEWESAEAFKAATAKMNAEANLPKIEGVVPSPDLYSVIRRD